MSFGKRSAVVGSLAVAGAIALTGLALAGGDSTATLEFTPDKVPKQSYRNGALSVHTHTDYTGATKTFRAQLNFDDDLRINPAGIPRCNANDISGNITMQQAMAACGNAKVGSGRAEANAVTPGDVKGCVLAFNGRPSGGRPSLLLFTRLNVIGPIDCSSPATNQNGNTPVLLKGLLKGASGDFGTQLDVNNIPQALPLSDFKTTIKRGSYVSARCQDADRTWNLRTKFTYLNPSATQTVNDSQTCEVSQSAGPPNTKITKAKISQRRHKAKFKFKAKGEASGFQCKLKGKHQKKGFRSCDSPKKYKHLKHGKYKFKVRAVGPGGKDGSPAKKSFKIRRGH